MSGTPDPPPEQSHPQSNRWWRWLVGGNSLEGVGQNPDYRFTLANERTFLAWVRTALALVAGGVAVVQLVPEFSVAGGRRVLGVVLILLAIIVSGASYRRWQRNELALRLNQPLPPSRLPWLVAIGLLVVAALALVLVLISSAGAK
jgi:putative membrane protein